MSSLPGDVGGFAAALRLVLGVATIVCFDKGDVREVAAAVPLVAAALDAGAFAFLVRLSPSPLKPRAANFGPVLGSRKFKRLENGHRRTLGHLIGAAGLMHRRSRVP